MRTVNAALINIDDHYRPRTQKQVYNMTGLPSSTVSDHVRKLIRCAFIREKGGAHAQRNDKTYIPGKNSGYQSTDS